MTTDTPRADDFPRIGCVQHDCDACATRAQEFVQLAADLAACRKENDTLRGLLGNSCKPCPYCGLAADDQGKCPSGFPGCARADDQMLSAHFAAGYGLAKSNMELAACRAALRELVAVEDLCEQLNATSGWFRNRRQILQDYKKRKPRAWAAARAILQPANQPEGEESC